LIQRRQFFDKKKKKKKKRVKIQKKKKNIYGNIKRGQVHLCTVLHYSEVDKYFASIGRFNTRDTILLLCIRKVALASIFQQQCSPTRTSQLFR